MTARICIVVFASAGVAVASLGSWHRLLHWGNKDGKPIAVPARWLLVPLASASMALYSFGDSCWRDWPLGQHKLCPGSLRWTRCHSHETNHRAALAQVSASTKLAQAALLSAAETA